MQLALMTATVKLFLKKPVEKPQQLIQLVLTYATQEVSWRELWVELVQLLAAPQRKILLCLFRLITQIFVIARTSTGGFCPLTRVRRTEVFVASSGLINCVIDFRLPSSAGGVMCSQPGSAAAAAVSHPHTF